MALEIAMESFLSVIWNSGKGTVHNKLIRPHYLFDAFATGMKQQFVVNKTLWAC